MSDSVHQKPSKPDFIASCVVEGRYFFLDLDPESSCDWNVACGGYESTSSDYSINRDDFPYWCIEYVMSGKGQLELGDEEYDVVPGSVFTYGPGIPHRIRTTEAEGLGKYFVDFTGRAAVAALDERSLSPGSVLRVSRPDELNRLFEMIVETGQHHTEYAAPACAKLLDVLMMKLAENRMGQKQNRTDAYRTYERCSRQIEKHFLEMNCLGDIARACHVNRSYLCRLFKRYDNQSPYNKLQRMKMEKAAEMLLNTNQLVKQVAHDLDFSDPYHFSRAFKRVYGISPDKFRRAGY